MYAGSVHLAAGKYSSAGRPAFVPVNDFARLPRCNIPCPRAKTERNATYLYTGPTGRWHGGGIARVNIRLHHKLWHDEPINPNR